MFTSGFPKRGSYEEAHKREREKWGVLVFTPAVCLARTRQREAKHRGVVLGYLLQLEPLDYHYRSRPNLWPGGSGIRPTTHERTTCIPRPVAEWLVSLDGYSDYQT